MVMEGIAGAQVVSELLESQDAVPCIQSCLSKYHFSGNQMFLRQLTFATIVTCGALWAQTAQPSVNDTEQRQNGAGETPLPTVHTFPEAQPNGKLAPELAPPIPNAKVALIGGTVKEMDPIRNRMKVKVFGGNDMKVWFDNRSRVTSNGENILPTKIKKGDRVYLDTQNIHGTFFARQVQVNNRTVPGEVKGRVTDFDPQSGKLRIFDNLSGSELALLVTPETTIKLRDAEADRSRLQSGAFLTARYQPGRGTNKANEIQVIVAPGESFRFVGVVRNLDLKAGFVSIENQSDNTIYELRATPAEMRAQNLSIGSEVDVQAQFDGNDYVVQSLKRLESTSPAEQNQQ